MKKVIIMLRKESGMGLLEVSLVAALICIGVLVGVTYAGYYFGPQTDGLETKDIVK